MSQAQAAAAFLEALAQAVEIVSAPAPARDAGESNRVREDAKQQLVKVKKSLERLGHEFRDALHYFLGPDNQLLVDAYEGIDMAIKKLR